MPRARAGFPPWFSTAWTAITVIVGVGLVRLIGGLAQGAAQPGTLAGVAFFTLGFAALAALLPLVTSSYVVTAEGLRRERRDRVVWSVTWREIKAATSGFSIELTRIELHDGRRLTLLRAMDGYEAIVRALRAHVAVPREVDDVSGRHSAFTFIMFLGAVLSAWVVIGFFYGWPLQR